MDIKLKNIKKIYNEKTVLDIEDLTIKKGVITGILGPNGSGKTTMMRIIAQLIKADQGEVNFEDKKFENISKILTYVSHTSYLFNDTVYKNIAMPLEFRNYKKKEIKNRVEDLIDTFKIGYIKEKNALKLSGGEKQKVSLARALSFHPKILLVDEPTSNIDPNFIKLIEKNLIMINKKYKTTIVIVTHNTAQSFRICDEIVFLKEGKILYKFDPKETKYKENNFIKEFVELN